MRDNVCKALWLAQQEEAIYIQGTLKKCADETSPRKIKQKRKGTIVTHMHTLTPINFPRTKKSKTLMLSSRGGIPCPEAD